MTNNQLKKPNFVLLKQVDGKGPLVKVTICKRTFLILDEEILTKAPKIPLVEFCQLLDEGNRFFNQSVSSKQYVCSDNKVV